jgi:phosphoglycolate phosphatase-like HAD superfamily hydrolase
MTLVNTTALAEKSYKMLSKFAGMRPTQEGFDEYVGRRVSESLDFFSKNIPEKKKELLELFIKIHTRDPLKLKVYGKSALTYLKNKKIKIIIVSRNSKKVIQTVAQAHNMLYDQIVADEDMKKGEEKHQAILRTLKTLKLKKEEIYYVGDHINDIKEAKKAGVKIISVTTGVFKAKDLMPYKPDLILEDLNELRKIV